MPVSYFFEQYELTFGNNGILSDNKASFDDNKDISEKEILTLIKNFTAIKDPSIRKSIITLTKTLSKKEEDEGEVLEKK